MPLFQSYTISFAETFENANNSQGQNTCIQIDSFDMFLALIPSSLALKEKCKDQIHVDRPQTTFAQVATFAEPLHQPLDNGIFICGLEGQKWKHGSRKGSAKRQRITHDDDDEHDDYTVSDFDRLDTIRKGIAADRRRSKKCKRQRQLKLQEMLLQPCRRTIVKYQMDITARQQMYNSRLVEAEKDYAMQLKRRAELFRHPNKRLDCIIKILAFEIKAHNYATGIYSSCETDEDVVRTYRMRLKEAVKKMTERWLATRYEYLFRGHSYYNNRNIPVMLPLEYSNKHDCWEMLNEIMETRVIAPAIRRVNECKSTLCKLESDAIRYAVSNIPKLPSGRHIKKMPSRVQYARLFVPVYRQ